MPKWNRIPTEEEMLAYKERYERGESLESIGKEIGISGNLAGRRLRKIGTLIRKGSNQGIETETTRVCKICKIEKPKSDFGSYTQSVNGLTYLRWRCENCHQRRVKETREKLKKTDPDYQAREHYKRLYGITFEVYQAMLEAQGFRCAICGKRYEFEVMRGKVRPGIRKFCLDHHHATGKVRGLLCMNCNHGLGSFKEDTGFLMNAIEYLRKHHGDVS